MNIVIVSPEAVPYAKTGGLADVTGAFFRELLKHKRLTVNMFLPFYKDIRERFGPKIEASGLQVLVGERTYYFDILSIGKVFFISNDYFFNRGGLYGDERGDFPDNAERFAFFCMAVLRSLQSLGVYPDILHLHEWQTGLIPLYQKAMARNQPLAKTVLTLHNLGFQGIFSPAVLPKIGISKEFFTIDGLEFYGKVNLLKAAIVYSDKVTTVSSTHAEEITTADYGFSLDRLLKAKGVTGILNGLDYTVWNPKKDGHIEKNYDKNAPHGKAVCKNALCNIFGIGSPSLPLMGIVGRLTEQKGYDIFVECMDEIIKMGVNIAVLGRGDAKIEKSMTDIALRHPGRIGLTIGFSEDLARKIYAGSDMFLIPSRYEPCGLAQMIAMRYGSVPIVRMTGGLADTVKDFNPADTRGTGFVFRNADVYGIVECVKRALCVFKNKSDWEILVKNAMDARFQWRKSIRGYLDLYSSVVKGSASV